MSFEAWVGIGVAAFFVLGALLFRHGLRLDRARRIRVAEALFGPGGLREEKGRVVGRRGDVDVYLWDKMQVGGTARRADRAFSIVAVPCPPGHDFAALRREGSVWLRPLEALGRLNELKTGRAAIDDTFFLHGADAYREGFFGRDVVRQNLERLGSLPGFVALQVGSVTLDHDFASADPPLMRVKVWESLDHHSVETLESIVEVLVALRAQLG